MLRGGQSWNFPNIGVDGYISDNVSSVAFIISYWSYGLSVILGKGEAFVATLVDFYAKGTKTLIYGIFYIQNTYFLKLVMMFFDNKIILRDRNSKQCTRYILQCNIFSAKVVLSVSYYVWRVG